MMKTLTFILTFGKNNEIFLHSKGFGYLIKKIVFYFLFERRDSSVESRLLEYKRILLEKRKRDEENILLSQVYNIPSLPPNMSS